MAITQRHGFATLLKNPTTNTLNTLQPRPHLGHRSRRLSHIAIATSNSHPSGRPPCVLWIWHKGYTRTDAHPVTVAIAAARPVFLRLPSLAFHLAFQAQSIASWCTAQVFDQHSEQVPVTREHGGDMTLVSAIKSFTSAKSTVATTLSTVSTFTVLGVVRKCTRAISGNE